MIKEFLERTKFVTTKFKNFENAFGVEYIGETVGAPYEDYQSADKDPESNDFTNPHP